MMLSARSTMRFDDDVVIVTGAGRGLGREHALLFAERGAKVVVNDVGVAADGDSESAAVAQSVVDEIISRGGSAVADTHSVSDAKGASAVVQTALDNFGKVTVLVNNAGIISFAPIEDIEDDQWRRMMAVTLDGSFYMSRAVWPLFKKQNYGRIVNTTSNAGFAGNATLVHYAAAKLGVAGLTKALAQEAVGSDITVNAIAPMAITRMNREAFFGGAEIEGDNWQEDIRSGKAPMGPASAISPTVLWLSHRSTNVNGDIYSSSSGKVSRVAFIIGEGYFDPRHTAEDLQENADVVRSMDNYLDPKVTLDELALIPPLFAD